MGGEHSEERGHAPNLRAGFDPELAERQAAIAPSVHEILDSDGVMPSQQLKHKIAVRVLRMGCTAGWERVVDPDDGKITRYAVLRTGRGDLRTPVGVRGWVEAFERLGVFLDE